MYSYHIVAELRQFRGTPAAADQRIHSAWRTVCRCPGTESCHCGLTGMDRIFLAIMVSAVLLLIVASDLLVNGPSRQDQTAQMANIQPVVARLMR
ncbi:hypothetical protein QWJ07_05735 [Frankia sp. RB7]|nr:hypothetical protein [Frankia sp. RB7]